MYALVNFTVCLVQDSRTVCCESAGALQIHQALKKKGHLSTGTKDKSLSWLLFLRVLISLMSGPKGPCRAAQSCWKTPPNFFLSPSPVARSKYRPTSVCFCFIVNKRDKLSVINNIAMTSTPMLPREFAARSNSISRLCKKTKKKVCNSQY